MKKNIALMALTGILTLASCGQNNDSTPADKVAPTATLTASPASLSSSGGTVTLSGTASDASGIASVVVTRNDGVEVCRPTVDANNAFSCTTSVVANSSTTNAVSYTYTATVTDKSAAANQGKVTSNAVSVAPATPNNGGNPTPTTPTTFDVVVTVTGVASAPVVIADANGFPLQTITVAGTKTLQLANGTYVVTPQTVAGYDTPAAKTIVVNGAKTGVAFNYTATVTPPAPAADDAVCKDGSVALDSTQKIGYTVVNGVTIAEDRNARDAIKNGGWIAKKDNAGAVYCYVRGTVKVYLNQTVADGAQVEAYYQTTLPGSAMQKLDVHAADSSGHQYVMFDSTMGVNGDTQQHSAEGYLTKLWFRVNNTSTAQVNLIPDNIAPEPINPQIDAKRSKILKDTNWVAGDFTISAANKAIRDLPYLMNDSYTVDGSDDLIDGQAGFESVRYYLVPANAKIDDMGGDNPNGLVRFVSSIKDADVLTKSGYNTPMMSAGQDSRGFIQTVLTNTGITYTPGKGYYADPAKTVIADGAYKLYAVTRDKLGNERPSSEPFRFTIDNLPAKLAGDQKIAIVDDSPLPFPAEAGYGSDYVKITVPNFSAATDSGIGPDFQNWGCTFNGLDLMSLQGTTTRWDSNKWNNGQNDVSCSNYGKDLLENYDPKAVNTVSGGIFIDNTDPTIDITSNNSSGTLTSGHIDQFSGTTQDTGSGVRQSWLFWSGDYSNTTKATTPANTDIWHSPIEFARSYSSNRVQGDFRIPSFDSNMKYDTMNIRGLVIDRAGNATLRRRNFNYVSNDSNTFAGSTFMSNVYPATSTNSINPLYPSYNVFNRIPAAIPGDATLALDSRTVVPRANNLEAITAYGHFNTSDWNAIASYMLTSSHDNERTNFPGAPVAGDIWSNLDADIFAANGGNRPAGDPSYTALGANNTNTAKRDEWATMAAPYLTLGKTNTPDNNGMYLLTNSLRNEMVSTNIGIQHPAKYPNSCPDWTYCTNFNDYFDQMIGAATADDGDIVFFGRNVTK